MHNDGKTESRPLRVGRGGMPGEKPKDLALTLKKLFKYLKGFLSLVIIALVLAATASIFSIIGPDHLSDLTDELSKGLVVNKDKLNEVMTEVTSTLTEENIARVSKFVAMPYINQEVIININASKDITNEDKIIFNNFIKENSNNEVLSKDILTLPYSIKKIILPEITLDGKKISTKDREMFIKAYMGFSNDMKKEDMAKVIGGIPNSVLEVLMPDGKIDGIKITSKEKVAFVKEMSEVDKNSAGISIYKALDKLPSKVEDLVKPKLNFDVINKIVIFLLTIYLLSALFNFLESFIMATVANNFAKNLRTKISVKLNKLALKYFDSHSYGDILSRVTNDVDMIGVTMSQSLGTLVSAFTLLIGSVVMMFATNWILALTAMLASLLGFGFMIFILGKSQKYFLARQVELGKLNGHIEEIYSSHNVVKAYNGNEDASKTFDKLNESVFECNRMSQFLSGLMPSMMNFIGHFGYVAVCVVGSLLVINGHITFGVIVAFMIYVRLFTSPLSQIAQGMTNIQSTIAAAERVFEFVEEPEMEDESNLNKKLNPKKVKGNIEFKHVKFGYDENKIIIKDFSCKVKPGEKIAIVGPTGAGKTTMVNLLMKFYNINDGDILIDGTSIKELTRENIHKLFIMVLQDTWLFNGSIRDNIKYNKEHVTDKEIMKALETVGVDHFVKSLPGGLNYQITDNESVSAGQKQLLTIARGMIENAPFLILDEATSSVDTRTEELVQKAMDKLTKGRTSFIIAHRLSTIKNADLILVMNEGNIIEQGNHEELMKKNGFYAELYNSQFKN